MRLAMLLSYLCIVAASVILAGCVTPSEQITPVPTTPMTPAPTTHPTASPTPIATTPVMTPEPTVTLPSELETQVSVTSEDVFRTIFVTYNGGKGQILLQEVRATVTTPSGGVFTRSLTRDGGQIPMGASLEFKGERGENRVEIWVTINGVVYKIKEEKVYFR
ncbi:MAG: hypothetical protein QHG99_00965 [Methanomicrobiales archaeon]|nr:hypothetical protein [Methanomicrobiales archaeon]